MMNDELKEAQIRAMAQILHQSTARAFSTGWCHEQATIMYDAAMKALDVRTQLPRNNPAPVVSLTAARADKTKLAKDWTAKDALERALTKADEWETAVVVLGRILPDGNVDLTCVLATPNRFVTQGMLVEALNAVEPDD